MYFLMGLPITMTGFFQVLYIKKYLLYSVIYLKAKHPIFSFNDFNLGLWYQVAR